MLAIKWTPNIFLISVYIFPSPLQQDICYVEVGVLKNWEQLFLSVIYSVFIWGRSTAFIYLFLTYIFTRYLRNIHEKKFWTHEIPTRKNFGLTKYPWEKIWTHEISTRKNFGLTNYPREKISDPRNTHKKKILDPRRHGGTIARDPRWHETHGI